MLPKHRDFRLASSESLRGCCCRNIRRLSAPGPTDHLRFGPDHRLDSGAQGLLLVLHQPHRVLLPPSITRCILKMKRGSSDGLASTVFLAKPTREAPQVGFRALKRKGFSRPPVCNEEEVEVSSRLAEAREGLSPLEGGRFACFGGYSDPLGWKKLTEYVRTYGHNDLSDDVNKDPTRSFFALSSAIPGSCRKRLLERLRRTHWAHLSQFSPRAAGCTAGSTS